MRGAQPLRQRRSPARVLVVGCGALAPELVAITRGLPNVDVTCLPATLHNRPGGIPSAVRERIRQRRGDYDTIFVAYADCGTGGLLDRVVEEEGVERLPGAHCYEVFAGRQQFERLMDEEPGTFFLTDFLVRNFDRLVWRGLGLDRHPELLPTYFGSYRRVVYLAQTHDPALASRARLAAGRLRLRFERRYTGLAAVERTIQAVLPPGTGRKLGNTTRAGTPIALTRGHDRSPLAPVRRASSDSRIRLTATRAPRIGRVQVALSPGTAVNRRNGWGGAPAERAARPTDAPGGRRRAIVMARGN